MEMNNLYSVIVEDAVAETNDFLKHLHCGWRDLTFLTLQRSVVQKVGQLFIF